jgi:polysaccharide export outer membrane protein
MLRITVLVCVLVGSSAFAQTAPRPAARSTAPSASADATPAADYTLGVQDVLKIAVFDEPTLTGSYRIDSDGAFQYPLIGRIQAAGLTLRAVEGELTKRLADGWVRRPQVAVEVEQYRSRNVFIVGEVRTPGKYPLAGQTTLIEALALAGYMTPAAGSEILVLHPEASDRADHQLSPELTSAARTTRVNVGDLQAGRSGANVVLNEGDTIFVQRARTFFVGGNVRSPGRFTWEQGLTVQQALSLAGGLTEKGSNRRLKVTRVVNGKSKKVDIELEDQIQPDDVLEVPQRLL